MGITITNAMRLENLRAFRIVAGFGGIDGTIDAVGILEHEIVSGVKQSFFKGDFVLTSLYPIKDEPDKLIDLVEDLIDVGAAGLAVKNIYFKEIPDEVKTYADGKDFPIFIYSGQVCLEDVVYDLVKELKDDEDDAYLASKIHGLLGSPIGRDVVRRIAYEINGLFKDRVFVVCFMAQGDMREMVSAINKGPYRNPADKALVFGDSILLIHSTYGDEFNEVSFLSRLARKGEWTGLGTSGGLLGLDELDKAVRMALSANKVARAYGKKEVSFDRMGLYRFLSPCQDNYWIRSFYEETVGKLNDHDERYGGNLMETAEAFVLSGGDYSKAAGHLHVHVNTVRYRIGKVKELLNSEEDLASFQEELFVAVRLQKTGLVL